MRQVYFVKTPWWLKKIYPHRVWNKETTSKNMYLSFDDGPEPEVTPFVLDELKKFDAKASFFCIGQNVLNHPLLYQRILNEGHRVGNHTHRHYNGWKTKDRVYLPDIAEASKFIQSGLFRPPYGRLTNSQARKIRTGSVGPSSIVMWDVLSGDFDERCDAEKCFENVRRHAGPGSIVVFHDSIKAMDRLKPVLPRVLAYFSDKGYSFRPL